MRGCFNWFENTSLYNKLPLHNSPREDNSQYCCRAKQIRCTATSIKSKISACCMKIRTWICRPNMPRLFGKEKVAKKRKVEGRRNLNLKMFKIKEKQTRRRRTLLMTARRTKNMIEATWSQWGRDTTGTDCWLPVIYRRMRTTSTRLENQGPILCVCVYSPWPRYSQGFIILSYLNMFGKLHFFRTPQISTSLHG